MIIAPGRFTERAPRPLTMFVLACAIIITGLLYVMQKSQATASTLTTNIYQFEE